jgi:IS30 family transposase
LAIYDTRRVTSGKRLNPPKKVHFYDPYSPGQRAANENTNRLLRPYLPKGSDFSGYARSELDKMAMRLHQRPRKVKHLRVNCAQGLP